MLINTALKPGTPINLNPGSLTLYQQQGIAAAVQCRYIKALFKASKPYFLFYRH